MQVNYLGHWLLVHNLMDHQRKLRRQQKHKLTGREEAGESKEGTRVLFFSSVTHVAGSLNFSEASPFMRAGCVFCSGCRILVCERAFTSQRVEEHTTEAPSGSGGA